ncbi:hypothetical protein BSKO_06614 [Bryopsis sp. KO-2023]|nr:hypothetical protein BSKO_06614 [Bryopsis sp. KO-2023]
MECDQVTLGLEDVHVVMVASGRYHSIALTGDGNVFTWGLNDWGQLGRFGKQGKEEETCTSGSACRDGVPGQISGLPAGVKFVHIAAGRYVSSAVSEEGGVYTWGHDGCASKGVIPERSTAWHPRLIKGQLEGRKVVKMDIGYVFWIALTDSGEVFTCDTGDDGYAGTLPTPRQQNIAGELGREGVTGTPGKVGGELDGKKVVSVAAGRDHALAVTEEGHLYSWGKRGGNLGRSGFNSRPGRVPSDEKFMFVGAGEYFSLAATEGKVFGFGANGYGALGVVSSKPSEIAQPTPVDGPLSQGKWRIIDIKAGYQHSMVIAHPLEAQALPDTKTSPEEGLGQQQIAPQAVIEEEDNGTFTNNTTEAKLPDFEVNLKPLYETFEGNFDLATYKVGFSEADPVSYLAGQVGKKLPSVSEALAKFKRSPRHQEIVAGSPDTFEMLPDAYEANFTNPCWRVNGQYKCIPFYHILGVSKCGTTDMYRRLIRHPNIYDSKNKGPHFWDESRWPPPEPSKGFPGYVDLFSTLGDRVENDTMSITGDASSNTFTGVKFFYRGAARHLNVTLADLLHEAQPYLRLIVIFRNPVDRYFSAYHYYRNRDEDGTASPEAFHEDTVNTIKRFVACTSSRSRESCVDSYEPQQLVKGMYSEFVDDWLDRFPREQLLFLRTDDYKVAMREHLKALFKFLEVRHLSDKKMDEIVGQEKSNNHRVDHDPMLPKTRQLLQSFYAPFNARLAAKLNDSRYLW